MSAEARNQWGSRLKVFKLLKRKTLATSEANKLVKCGERQNGWESCRLLNLRYEPQSGVGKAHEFRQLMLLMGKACKTPADTALLIMEIDRRQICIDELGGSKAGDEGVTSILLTAMDPSTRTYAMTKLDLETLSYAPLKQATLAHCGIQSSTGKALM